MSNRLDQVIELILGCIRYTVSPRLENKLMYHIAVLCLMVDDYDVDIYDLKVDMNITPKEYGALCTNRDREKS